ncbi:hypothetical protein AYI68_g4383 [Smittium mucronatum]|uniref:Uncharacterized protein n=1 Tax=Smittium mucronatum TaxID=133383 RepID=A0A1R0GX93_9FUNG|nr:hypothetical protein AYI68_g4383 [Smittium mucronatum]
MIWKSSKAQCLWLVVDILFSDFNVGWVEILVRVEEWEWILSVKNDVISGQLVIDVVPGHGGGKTDETDNWDDFLWDKDLSFLGGSSWRHG